MYQSISDKRHTIIFWAIIIFFGSCYSLISLVNHYNFRTSAYDLGIYTNQLYHYLHGDLGNTVIYPNMTNKWADHFSVFQVIFSPFLLLFGTYTLLVVQIFFILLGGVGIKKMVFHYSQDKLLSLLGMGHFFLIWGIYSALSFDYHDNVIGAMMVPWMLYHFLKRNYLQTFLLLVCILLCKEAMSLWMFFVGAFMIFLAERKSQKRVALSVMGLSIVYFVVVFFMIMPNLIKGFEYKHFSYDLIGGSYKDVVMYFLQNPLDAFLYLFANHSGDATYDGIKLEFWYMFLLSGGLATIRYPKFLLALLPIILLKMYNDDFGKWGINNHYSIETAPIITFALYYLIIKQKNFNRFKLAAFFIVICGTLTLIKLNNRKSKWYDKKFGHFLIPEHYQSPVDTKHLYEVLSRFDDDDKICATSALVPHLSIRDHIYTYPHIGDAEYIILNKDLSNWPVPSDKIQKELQVLNAAKEWELFFEEKGTYIFRNTGENSLFREDIYLFFY